ncbi:MAG TPA: GNAT family N-acetyltransferase [Hyphomicrobiaceae bacterium]|nr:GNAT family N-acetyltransferase [Hyphomicrobiaceae bacterium]
MSSPDVVITPYLAARDVEGLTEALERIFFEASATKSFPDEAARTAFRERWLGRYLEHWPADALLAFAPGWELAGYLVGCLHSPPDAAPLSDIHYFRAFSPLLRDYPAHLHVNMAPAYRGHGIGSRLIAAFVAHAAAAGAAGVHVVTGKGMRNVGFYQRNGFTLQGEATLEGRTLVLLGRRLAL